MREPKTLKWKKARMLSGMAKAGWHFFFVDDGGLWGSFESFKLKLEEDLWILYEDLPAGLAEIKRSQYDRRQSQEIRREIQKVKTRRKRNAAFF